MRRRTIDKTDGAAYTRGIDQGKAIGRQQALEEFRGKIKGAGMDVRHTREVLALIDEMEQEVSR